MVPIGISDDRDRMQATAVPPELFACWQFALVHWNQRTAHDTLLGVAAKHHQLAWLAARYRGAARSNPHDCVARDRLQRVRRASTLLAFAPPPARAATTTAPRAAATLLVAAMLFAGLGLWLTDYLRQQQHATMVSRHP